MKLRIQSGIVAIAVPVLYHLWLVALLLSLFSLAGCAIYKIDVQQGNEITTEMLAELKIGMSKQEVSQTLGFPLINDPFHADRWDYYFYHKKGSTGEVKQHSATLWFADDSLSEFRSSLLP